MNKNIWQLKIQCCDASKKCEVDSTYKLGLLHFELEWA